jgi:RNA polymerase sigma-70 factor (ECF subfamily)
MSSTLLTKGTALNEADEALVNRSRAGDRLAFEELIRHTARLVFARLYLETGDSHEAEDLSQETFLTAFRRIHQLSDATNFRGWLLSIAHSVLIDSARNKSRLKRGAGQTGSASGPEPMDDAPTPPQSAQRRDECQKALSILRSMPEEYRQPLTLRYLAGADYETIGRELGLTNGSLRGLLHRGLNMLREQLKSMDVEIK